MSYRPITDVWILGRPKAHYYGAYPSGFLERARALLGVTIHDPVLHVCGGKIREYQSGPMKCKGLGPNDCTVDLDPALEPDFLLDVRRIGVSPGDVFPFWAPDYDADFRLGGNITTDTFNVVAGGEAPFGNTLARCPWHASLIDRPYTAEDAAHYATDADVLPNLNDLLRRTLSVTRVGGRVGVLDYVLPRPPREGVKFIALVAVSTGYDQRARWFSVFERLAVNPLEYNVTGGAPEVDEVDEVEEADASPVPVVHIDTHSAASPVRKKKTTKKKTKPKVTKKRRLKKVEKTAEKPRARIDVTDGFEW